VAAALWVLTFVVVVLIAIGAVNAVSARLAVEPRVSVYDLAEAVEFVAERLPPEATARLTYDEVEAVLLAHIEVLAVLGVAAEAGGELPAVEPAITVDDDEILAHVLGALAAGEGEEPLADEDVALVLEVEAQYVEAIGAVGAVVRPAE